MTEVLTNKNFLLFCAKHYDTSQCTDTEEFLQDIKRLKYIKKAFTVYKQTGVLKTRLVLNHFIILNNMFSSYALPRMLFLKMNEHADCFVPFLIYLNIMPDYIMDVKKRNMNIRLDEIALNPSIVQQLRTIR